MRLWWLLVVVAGCYPGLPQVPEPRTVAAHQMYVPYVVAVPNKLGLAGGNGAQADALGARWVYQWVPQCEAGDVECVPMIWGRNDMTATVSSGSWLMGFNEPDMAKQANLTPAEAAVLWREIEDRWAGKRLLAPAPSHLHPEWIEGFYAAYVTAYGRAPRLDGLAFHCYRPTAAECIEIGTRFVGLAQAWGVEEVWCTEFAFVPAYSGGDADDEAAEFVTWLEQQPMITRYAPFVAHITCDWSWPDCRPSANPSLFAADGSLTEIGNWYAKATW